LANVISDISGVTGIGDIAGHGGGERDPHQLAALKNEKIQASREEIARSLEGNWREELLFVLAQSLELYDTYLGKIAACDRRLEAQLKTMEGKMELDTRPVPEARRIQSGLHP